MNVLEVKNLSVQYPGTEGASEIVKDISFTVEEGGVTRIVFSRSLRCSSARDAMIAGTEHPNPSSIGRKALPDRPRWLIISSMT